MSSSSSRRRRFPVRRSNPVVGAVDVVGCGCRKSKLFSSLFSSSSTSSSFSSSFRRTSKQKQTKPSSSSTGGGRHLQSSSANNRRHPLSSYYPFSPSASAGGWDTSRDLSVSSTGTTATVATTFSGPSDYSSPPPPPPPPTQPPARRSKKKMSSSAAAAAAAGQASSPARSVGRVAEESVAVVKESSDPYHDFRDSMLQMIVEKELYGWDDLRGLLHRFLTLNSPCHHDAILRAFSEIWASVYYGAAGQVGGGEATGVVPPMAAATAGPQGGSGQRRRRGNGPHRRRVPREQHGQEDVYHGYGACQQL